MVQQIIKELLQQQIIVQLQNQIKQLQQKNYHIQVLKKKQ